MCDIYHSANKVGYLVSLFNGISNYMGYLMPKSSLKKNSNGTNKHIVEEDKEV